MIFSSYGLQKLIVTPEGHPTKAYHRLEFLWVPVESGVERTQAVYFSKV
jgi:hypothetical protein